MSWSFNFIGKKFDIDIFAIKEIPLDIRSGVDRILEAFPEKSYEIECNGHVDEKSGTMTLIIRSKE